MFWALLFLVAPSVVVGQTTVVTTTFTPKSACGIAALKCYTDQQDTLKKKQDAFDFVNGCRTFKTILDCMDLASDGECQNDPDFLAVRQGAINDQDGICGVDGSVQSCGVDVKVCFTAMDASIADVLSKNFTQACPLIITFASCANNVIKQKECSPAMTTALNQMTSMLGSDKTLIGCNGKCSQAVAACTVNATTLPTDSSIASVDLNQYCQSSSRVYNCLKNLTSSSLCSTPSSGSSGSIDPGQFLSAVTQNALAKVGDVCDLDGTPSQCVSDLAQCSLDLTSVTKTSSKDTVCSAASAFLECISRLPCSTSLSGLVSTFRNTLETGETEDQCPSVGSCNERFAKCGAKANTLTNYTIGTDQAVCAAAKQGISCFDFVKKDPYCINEKNSMVTEEQSYKQFIVSLKCSAASIQATVLLPVILFVLNKFL